MTPEVYTKLALQTESRVKGVQFDETSSRMLHAALGIATEAGELLDIIKKSSFYGKPFDTVNAVEELGDLCWYLAIACDTLGVTFEEVWTINIDKLRKRYPKGFTEESALNRNLEAERDVLEKRNLESIGATKT